jgi:hypothetical protein
MVKQSLIYDPVLDPSGNAMVTPGVRPSAISATSSGLVTVVSGRVISEVSVTVLDPSAFVMVVVYVVVNVPSGLRVLVVTSSATAGVTGMAVALPASTATGGELKAVSGLFCKARVAQPAKAHKMEAMMHKIPARSILQSSTLVQISEAKATWN